MGFRLDKQIHLTLQLCLEKPNSLPHSEHIIQPRRPVTPSVSSSPSPWRLCSSPWQTWPSPARCRWASKKVLPPYCRDLQDFLATSKRALGHFTEQSERYHREEEVTLEACGKEQQWVPVWDSPTGASFTSMQRGVQPESSAACQAGLDSRSTTTCSLLWLSATATHPCTASRHLYKWCLEGIQPASCAARVCTPTRGVWSQPQHPNNGWVNPNVL